MRLPCLGREQSLWLANGRSDVYPPTAGYLTPRQTSADQDRAWHTGVVDDSGRSNLSQSWSASQRCLPSRLILEMLLTSMHTFELPHLVACLLLGLPGLIAISSGPYIQWARFKRSCATHRHTARHLQGQQHRTGRSDMGSSPIS